MSRVTQLWSRLPVGVTRILGPRLRPYFSN